MTPWGSLLLSLLAVANFACAYVTATHLFGVDSEVVATGSAIVWALYTPGQAA